MTDLTGLATKLAALISEDDVFVAGGKRVISHVDDPPAMVAILREEGICVRKLWTTHPGRVVYSDQHQIGAIPTRNSNALRV